jgi:Importin-beta N-terminal domain
VHALTFALAWCALAWAPLLSCQAIMGAAEADHSARWLASVQLKNNISRHWQSRPNQRCLMRWECAGEVVGTGVVLLVPASC